MTNKTEKLITQLDEEFKDLIVKYGDILNEASTGISTNDLELQRLIDSIDSKLDVIIIELTRLSDISENLKMKNIETNPQTEQDTNNIFKKYNQVLDIVNEL
ncbi:hypothetical protein BB559_002573 [Furculomyces boomerangus]|uniref:Uncharacterized protein n=2 Tax=Harpellales TaxID=61421 RepID=A0A2T9YUG4_9FUNG|nr:hypothetical protein BB559_002573 [Furculomyces boomerangus]PWA03141.1 hypothetical protein BB558_000694 [Smittium angustum]